MIVRSVLRFAFRQIVAIYFREIEVAGEVPSKDTGGRLFGANHVNALVDPILVLTQAPCVISPIAKSTLWKIPGLRWLLDAASAVPIQRRRDNPEKTESANDEIFSRVASHLGRGGNILIFPEGTSHNEPRLLGLRSGAGRMLARAKAESGADALTFQAVALEFDARDIFRSRALVLFGPVRRVAELTGEDVASEVTARLRDDLSDLLVEGETWDERILIVRVAEMFAAEERGGSLEEVNRFGRRVEQARRILAASDPATVKAIEDRARAYFARLDEDEIADRAVARAGADGALELARVLRAAALIATLPLAVVGALLYWLPYQLPRFVTRRLKGDPDVASTYKLGVGLAVYPLWTAAAITTALVLLPPSLAVVATAIVVASPFAALAWLDRWDHLASRARRLAPSEERRERMLALLEERTALLHDLETARARVE